MAHDDDAWAVSLCAMWAGRDLAASPWLSRDGEDAVMELEVGEDGKISGRRASIRIARAAMTGPLVR